MGETIRLTAQDGHVLPAYRAEPKGKPQGGIVVIQEIFGVNAHIRGIADRLAREGYAALAPALFERIERQVELSYTEEDTGRGRELRTGLGWDKPVADVAAAIAALGAAGRVGVVGFCWGGSLGWLAATRLGPASAVCYYGAQIVEFKDETPGCPVLMHFGAQDPLIAVEDVETIRAAQPAVTIHTYAAGHGFNCDMREDFEPECAALAWERTLAHFSTHLG
ncbi:MAG: dienelactone hydrolase family protein [Alphaproteobacteria bacterium]